MEGLGASLSTPELICIALSGFGCDATPVEVDVEVTLGDINLKMPTWDEFKGVGDNMDKFKALNMEINIFKLKNVIGLPPTMVDAFLESPAKDPASLTITFLSVMLNYDNNHNAEDPPRQKLMDEFKHLIQFCWLAHKQLIQPLTYSNSDDPKVTSWCCKLHEINITQTIETQTHGVDAQISDRDQQVVYTLMSLHQKMDSNQATQIEKEEAKKPGSKTSSQTHKT